MVYRHINIVTRKNKDKYKIVSRRSSKKSRKKQRKQRTYKNRAPRQYAVYIKSPYWTKRKNLYWKSFKKQCVICGSTGFVALHHLKYASDYYGKEPDSWLVPFCNYHHSMFHEEIKTKPDMTTETHTFIANEIEKAEFSAITKDF